MYNAEKPYVLLIFLGEIMCVKTKISHLARLCHEVNRGFCEAIGDYSPVPWEHAPEWQKESARNGVILHLKNPDSTPEDSHKAWVDEKESAGWMYGAQKKPDLKEHPCLVPFAELSVEQRAKDFLFRAVVSAFVRVASSQGDQLGWDIVYKNLRP